MCTSTSKVTCHAHSKAENKSKKAQAGPKVVGAKPNIPDMSWYLPQHTPSLSGQIGVILGEVEAIKHSMDDLESAGDDIRDMIQIKYYACMKMEKERTTFIAEAENLDSRINVSLVEMERLNQELGDFSKEILSMKEGIEKRERMIENLAGIEEARLAILAEMEADEEAEPVAQTVDKLTDIVDALLLDAEPCQATSQIAAEELLSKTPIRVVAKGVEVSVLEALG